jgi:hypothetical protein
MAAIQLPESRAHATVTSCRLGHGVSCPLLATRDERCKTSMSVQFWPWVQQKPFASYARRRRTLSPPPSLYDAAISAIKYAHTLADTRHHTACIRSLWLTLTALSHCVTGLVCFGVIRASVGECNLCIRKPIQDVFIIITTSVIWWLGWFGEQ